MELGIQQQLHLPPTTIKNFSILAGVNEIKHVEKLLLFFASREDGENAGPTEPGTQRPWDGSKAIGCQCSHWYRNSPVYIHR